MNRSFLPKLDASPERKHLGESKERNMYFLEMSDHLRSDRVPKLLPLKLCTCCETHARHTHAQLTLPDLISRSTRVNAPPTEVEVALCSAACTGPAGHERSGELSTPTRLLCCAVGPRTSLFPLLLFSPPFPRVGVFSHSKTSFPFWEPGRKVIPDASLS